MSVLPSEIPPDPPRPSNQARRVQKINGVLEAISHNKWKSFNEFLVAFYTSQDPAILAHSQRTIAHVQGKAFPPERILDAWFASATGDTAKELRRMVTQKTTDILVQESTRACADPSLHLSSTTIKVTDLEESILLAGLVKRFQALLPCLWFLLTSLLTALNTYEKKNKKEKEGKGLKASRIAVVVISMLLYGRNRGTNVFQFILGMFLSSTGASRRVIDTFNHMGLSVSYVTVQRCLESMSESARKNARSFVSEGLRLWGIVYDNINFTLRKASQRLDSLTEQLNATTSAVFSLPVKFSHAAYATALSIAERNRHRRQRSALTLNSLRISEERQKQLVTAFQYHVRDILLLHAPGLRKHTRHNKALRKQTRARKLRLRVLSSAKTSFYPLPALAQEEASVSGTIKVVTKLFRDMLGLAEEMIDAELRLLVGDWLSIRNLRLMQEEVRYELSSFARMGWIQEASMPFHFQLNAIYMIYRTHLGHAADQDPASLHIHRTLLRRSKLDTKKPEYNKAKELVEHSLVARVLDCARVILKFKNLDDFKTWKPTWQEFDQVVVKLVEDYTMSGAAENAMFATDEVLAHSILFMRDALLFREFSDAIRYADVGRMWMVYDFWVFMMRGAGCHNYGNEISEMKAQFEHELPPALREVVERTWLVNRWGTKGRSIPTDLYLEHNNGFLKASAKFASAINMFAAQGSNASMEQVQNKSSACIEVLRSVACDFASFFGINESHRRHREVNACGDIQALAVDLASHRVHIITSNRPVLPPPSTGRKKRSTGVRDVLTEGKILLEGGLFDAWKARKGQGTGLYNGDDEWEGGYPETEQDPVLEDEDEDIQEDMGARMDIDLGLDADDICPNAELDI